MASADSSTGTSAPEPVMLEQGTLGAPPVSHTSLPHTLWVNDAHGAHSASAADRRVGAVSRPAAGTPGPGIVDPAPTSGAAKDGQRLPSRRLPVAAGQRVKLR